ncbi:PREDICTED: uncharacterized protein LOC109158517 [Ipomoea nil]|uniref:uncharacterized protein LOC109158517 n=1 Tax=Ipomoea nil TaxID=35883 RepID=UPI00090188F8|nr:PREDICTED: uncharacterized protein LOC109158517 [Ipomoea nil]
MDIRQIEERCAIMSLAEEETGGLEEPVIQANPDSTILHNLVGRFLTDRAIKFDYMQQVMASVWRLVMGMHVVPLTDELFLFQFPHQRDLQRVVDEGPWTFENNMLICEVVPPGSRPEEIKLEAISFWIQVHGLPAVYASTAFLTQIGNYIGTFITTDPLNFGGAWRSFMRIRVRLDVAAPLKRRMKILRKDGTVQWINFRYERLSTFCFCCGVLGHSDKFCRRVYEEGIELDEFPFGTWMRASSRRQVKPVGAKWLLGSSTQPIVPSNIPAAGPSPLNVMAM